MSKRLYVVFGQCGEYSDRDEWTVAAYDDEAKAKAHAEAAKRWYQENDCLARNRWSSEWENPFDPFMRIDYTGTDWSVGFVEYRDALPSIENPQRKEP